MKDDVDPVAVMEASLEELIGPLSEIESKHAPSRLWIAGPMDIPLHHPRIAIVGTRNASSKGLERATEIARTLAGQGVIVISGLARGIDTAVHKSVIQAGGETIAVLGTPLARTYPKENLELQNTISNKHLVVSQFPMGYPIAPRNFVIRDRTMALISDATIIIESGDGGGSLHQGWEALRLGRPLFIHESVFRRSGISWPDKMTQYGAVRFDRPRDILDFVPGKDVSTIASIPLEPA